MRLLTLSLVFSAGFLGTASFAEDLRRLNDAEIKVALTNQTAISTDLEWPYRQYFRSDFTTIFAEPGKMSTLGKWKTGSDLYCSLWGAGEWECYQLWETTEGVVWIAELNAVRYPARLVDGEQLVEK